MANTTKIKQFFTVSVASLMAFWFLPVSTYATNPSASMYLAPASGTLQKDSILTVDIHEDSGKESINAVKAYLTYPIDKLDFISSTPSAAFNIVAENSADPGKVRLTLGAFPSVSGDQTVATISFKVKAGSGSASLAFTNDSAISKDSGPADKRNILTSVKGGTYSLSTPSSQATTQQQSTTTPVTQDNRRPTISNIYVNDISFNTATVRWTTSEPATSEVSYGLNKQYGLSAVDRAYVTDHKVTLSSALLSPGVMYHFMVKSVDPSGNVSASSDSIFTTKGTTLIVRVIDQNNRHVKNALVKFNDTYSKTDANGQTSFNNLPLGKLEGSITHKGKQTKVIAEINSLPKDGQPQVETYKIRVENNYLWTILFVLLGLMLLAGWWGSRKSLAPVARVRHHTRKVREKLPRRHSRG